MRRRFIGRALACVLVPAVLSAQGDSLDGRLVALTYHKVSGTPLDFMAAAQQSPVVQRATNFDRPLALKTEAARLQAELGAVDTRREFVVRVNDNISEYNHERGEFPVMLFQPGFYVEVDALGQRYRMLFANGESARAIAMPTDDARRFDARLAAGGRSVTDEIHFRIVGSGDPAGAVTGQRVIRAEISSVRVLDRMGTVLFTPRVVAVAAPSAPSGAAAAGASLDEVAGMRVGIKASDLDPTLTRLFGTTTKQVRGRSWFAGFASALVVNDLGCIDMPGARKKPKPGDVCVTAFLDASDVVRSIRVERVFPYLDAETFRATLVRRYGPVTDARESGTYALGWGAPVDATLTYDQSGPHTAVAAYYEQNDDFMTRGMNALPHIRVVLQLVDAKWAAAHAK